MRRIAVVPGDRIGREVVPRGLRPPAAAVRTTDAVVAAPGCAEG